MFKKYIYWVINSCLIVLLIASFNNFVKTPVNASDYVNKMVISHQNDQPIASPIIAQAPKTPVTGKSVNYGKIGNQNLTGYLSRPNNQNQPLPALIVIHEWWGLNDNVKAMTDRLAGEGYLALAVDLYNGNVAENREKAKEFVTEAMSNQDELKENIRQAYNYLKTSEKAPKIGSIGWCFGGLWSLNTALLFPKQLDATVIYYGGNITTNKNELAPLQMPILGIFGELDNNPPVSLVNEFEATLRSLNKPVEIYIYEGANHAFANPSGNNYNQKAAESAWQKTTTFLNKNLLSSE